jgi:hypothetical protein
LTNFDQTGVGQGAQLQEYAVTICTSSGTTATCTVPAMPASWTTGDHVVIGSLTPGTYAGVHTITKLNATTLQFQTALSNLGTSDNNGNATKIPAVFDEVAEPVVKWHNTQGVNEMPFNVPYPQIREYEHYATAATGTSLPVSCTSGQDWFWRTDESKLYRCSATNTWTLNYQPAAYPHPLTGTP